MPVANILWAMVIELEREVGGGEENLFQLFLFRAVLWYLSDFYLILAQMKPLASRF